MSAESLPLITEDRVLDGRIVLRQPVDGLRATIDPIFLAAAIAARSGESVLDLGAGSGVMSLCLAARLPEIRVVGLEIQQDLVRIATENVAINGMDARVAMIVGDITAPPPRLAPASFAHVMANPPYIEAGTGTVPPSWSKATATGERSGDLEQWVRAALMLVKSGGTINFVHRADRLDRLLAALSVRAGEIVVYPLWPSLGKPAKRVLVRARKDIKTPLRLSPGLVLHSAGGAFTAEAEAILRGTEALTL